MPYGRLAFLGIARETTWGTAVAAADYVRLSPTSYVRPAPEEIEPRSLIGVWDRPRTLRGMQVHRGELNFEVYPNSFGWFLLGALGPVTTTTPTGATVTRDHKFSARTSDFSSTCFLQPFTLELFYDMGQSQQFAGAIFEELSFTVGVREPIMRAQATVIARTLADITKTTPAFEATSPFLYTGARVNLPDPTQFVDCQSITVTIRNPAEALALLGGGTTPSRFVAREQRQVTISGTHLLTKAEWDAFRNATERRLVLIVEGGTIEGSFRYTVTVTVPKFRYTRYDAQVDAAGLLSVDWEGYAVFDFGTDEPLSITLRNSRTAY